MKRQLKRGEATRLFKRKPDLEEDDVVRCPACGERVPEGATECAMCGRGLRDVLEPHDGNASSEAERAEHR